ncbi:hypothetical protein HPP92_008993 [Vanilla planifolia]|uniref:Uncharacterized protein n=1 Tax=Vanilla planifolia TaxID=51239 RepID=A0A835RAN6_VANPL|nr:hypothetical protein HPP92_008993 [Vanilla planifolia]
MMREPFFHLLPLFASESPTHMLESSPLSPWLSDMNCLGISMGSAAARFCSSDLHFHKEGSSLPMQISSTWDFFDPNGDNCDKCLTPKFVKLITLSRLKESDVVPLIEEHLMRSHRIKDEQVGDDVGQNSHSSDACVTVERFHESKVEEADLQKELCAERVDASEFITHRAKDFLASMKDIEQRFLRAAEAGNHVSDMLGTKKNYLGISMVKTGPLLLEMANACTIY